MAFDIVRFLTDYRIDHQTAGCKGDGTGWVQIHCPFCFGNPGWHLGINLESGGCNCWRCGTHKLFDVIKTFVSPTPAVLSDIRSKYGSAINHRIPAIVPIKRREKIKMPAGVLKEIPKKASDYLISRGFDPVELIKTWGLLFTGPIGDYKFRIIAPIFYERNLVSYQGRDYTGKSELRYKACRKDDELRDHQSCLYGSWLAKGNSIVVVEGIADAWRMGPGAVATFGVAYTTAQLNLISQYKNIYLLFDGDEPGKQRANDLGIILKTINPGVNLEIIELDDGDPGEMDQRDANRLMCDLGFK